MTRSTMAARSRASWFDSVTTLQSHGAEKVRHHVAAAFQPPLVAHKIQPAPELRRLSLVPPAPRPRLVPCEGPTPASPP